MRRNIGQRGYLHIQTVTLGDGEDETVEMPGCTMFRVVCTAVASGATLLYRGADETDPAGSSDAPASADTDALVAADCDILSETRTESGWFDAQVSAIRLEAVTDTVTAKVMWTSRHIPVRS